MQMTVYRPKYIKLEKPCKFKDCFILSLNSENMAFAFFFCEITTNLSF
jgi:hypothetical protein